MNDQQLVSIITPSYNCARFIAATIESIQAQTYSSWELLITDDCSTDESRKIIAKYGAQDARIKLLELKENAGAGVARNLSIQEAKGRFIAFCDSDDMWYPEKLEKQLRFMQEHDTALSYTSYDVCNEEGKITGHVNCPPHIKRHQIIRSNGIGCLTAMYDTQKLGKCYMPNIRKRQDWCLWIDIISRYGIAHGMKEHLALYRIHPGSVSSNKFKLIQYNFNVYHNHLHFNALKSAIILFAYFFPYHFYKKTKIAR